MLKRLEVWAERLEVELGDLVLTDLARRPRGTADLIASRIPPGHLNIKSEGAMLQESIRVLEGTRSSRSIIQRGFLLIPACIRNGN